MCISIQNNSIMNGIQETSNNNGSWHLLLERIAQAIEPIKTQLANIGQAMKEGAIAGAIFMGTGEGLFVGILTGNPVLATVAMLAMGIIGGIGVGLYAGIVQTQIEMGLI